MKKILVIHGPNLNMLGERETQIYGKTKLDQINSAMKKEAKRLHLYLEVFQSNHEGEIVEKIQNAQGDRISVIIINPAAYTHTSIAIRDAVSSISIPTIEIHLSNIYAREEFRHTSLIAPVAIGQISGFGPHSYILGLYAACALVKKTK